MTRVCVILPFKFSDIMTQIEVGVLVVVDDVGFFADSLSEDNCCGVCVAKVPSCAYWDSWVIGHICNPTILPGAIDEFCIVGSMDRGLKVTFIFLTKLILCHLLSDESQLLGRE